MLSRRSLLRAGGGLALTAAGLAGGASSAFAAKGKWEDLRGRLSGDVVLPSDNGYALAKQLQIAQYDLINPQAIAFCETPADVRTSIQFACANDLPVRARSGGHNLAGWSTGDGLVIDVSRINHISVGESSIRIGSGLQAVDAINALKSFNKQIVAGTCPTVCAGGFLSGGGIGYQTRKFGIGCDRVVSANVALADGRIVRCSARENPELYWAVRGGGGGNFGIVVDFEVRPIEAPQAVNYSTIWSFDHARDVIAAWQAWCVDGPSSLGSILVVIPPYGGSASILIGGVYLGAKQDLAMVLNELTERAGVQPLNTTIGKDAPYADAMQAGYCGDKTLEQCHRIGQNPNALLPRTPFQRQSYQLINRALDVNEVDELLKVWATHPGLYNRYLQCIAVGGEANQPSRESSAWVHRDAQFLVGLQVGLDNPIPPADQVAEATAWTDKAAEVLARYASGSYINFPSSRPVDNWTASTYGKNFPRLQRVKRLYDPTNFFRHPQSIGR